MSAPASSASAAAAKPAKGPRPPKAEVVVPETPATAAGISAIRAGLSTILPGSSQDLIYKPKPTYVKDGVEIQPPTKLARSYETPEKACICLASPELTEAQLTAIESTANQSLPAEFRPLKLVKPCRAKGAEQEGYEFTFVVGETAKKLEAKTAKEKMAVESKKVGGGSTGAAAAAGEGAQGAAAASAVSPVAASASASASSPSPSLVASARPSSSQELYDLALVSFARLQLSTLPLEQMLQRVSPMLPEKYMVDLRKRLDTTPQFQALEVSRVLNDLSHADLLASLPEETRAFLRRDLFDASFDSTVRMIENESYTRGAEAARRGDGGINIAKLL